MYILQCADDTLYTGITNDLENRLLRHNRGSASKYTRSRLPVHLVYLEKHISKSAALKREYEVKRMKRQQKIKMIEESRGGLTVEKIIGH